MFTISEDHLDRVPAERADGSLGGGELWQPPQPPVVWHASHS